MFWLINLQNDTDILKNRKKQSLKDYTKNFSSMNLLKFNTKSNHYSLAAILV